MCLHVLYSVVHAQSEMDSELLKVYEDIALSDDQLLNLIDGKAHLVLYPDLVNYSNIDEVLGENEACVLLFEAKPNYGHWTCLHKRDGDIEFFNPYGGYPDDSLEYIPMHFREVSNQLEPYLSMLMYDSPYKLSFNEHKFQHKGSDIKTCGRHCAMRLIYRNLDLAEYTQLMKDLTRNSGLTTDEVVSYVTAAPDQLHKQQSGVTAGRRRY